MKRRGVAFFIAFLLVCCSAVTIRQRSPVPVDGSPQKGPANAQVTIVEFLDYT